MRSHILIQLSEEIGEERATERIALNMLSKGMDLLDVLECTGLSIDQVRALRETMPSEETAQPA